MRPASEPPRDLVDRILRQVLQHPANLRAFLRQAVPSLADGFDCERRRLLDREFGLDDWRRREADLPFEVPFRLQNQETWALVYVLIEHQSSPDPAMPLRMLYFVVLYWDRQWRAWEQRAAPKPPLRLRPVLPLVLYTGPGAWDNNRTLQDLLDEPAAFHSFVPQWGPLFWELGTHTADDLLQSGDAWRELLAVLRAQGEEAAEFGRVFVEALRRLEGLADEDYLRWCELVRSILSWAKWRRPRGEQEALFTAAPITQSNVNRQKEILTMEQTIGEAIWEEGWNKGMTEGMAKGMANGKTEGKREAFRQVLRDLLAERFGPLSEEIRKRIETCEDLDRLATAAKQVFRLDSIEDLQL